MKKLIEAAVFVAFAFMMGVVGAVEQGAELSRLLLIVPALAVLAICGRAYWRLYR